MARIARARFGILRVGLSVPRAFYQMQMTPRNEGQLRNGPMRMSALVLLGPGCASRIYDYLKLTTRAAHLAIFGKLEFPNCTLQSLQLGPRRQLN